MHLVRGGHQIVNLIPTDDGWVVVTVDRIETRPAVTS